MEALVKQVDDDYRALAALAYPQKRQLVVSWHSRALFELERYDLAMKLANVSDLDAIVKIAAKYRAGSTREAIKLLLQVLEDSGHNRNVAIGYGQLLCHYLESTEARGAALPASLVVDAKRCLRRLVGLFITGCKAALAEGDVRQARKYLRSAQYANGNALAPNLLHLSARISLAQIEAGDDNEDMPEADGALKDLDAAFRERPELRSDRYLRGVYLSVLARSAARSTTLKSEEIWEIARDTTDFAAPDLDRYNLTNALVWQMRTGDFTNWPERMVFTAERFSEDHHIAALPVRTWNQCHASATPVMLELIRATAHTPRGREWLKAVFSKMPSDFFENEAIAAGIADLVTAETVKASGTHIARLLSTRLAEGFAAGQIQRWATPEAERGVAEAAKWFECHLPFDLHLDVIVQWLGCRRGDFERVVVQTLTSQAEDLHERLMCADSRDRAYWLGALTAFLGRVRRPQADPNVAIESPLRAVIEFCTRASRDFVPGTPDSSYWWGLRHVVSEWLLHVGPEDLGRELGRAWVLIHRALEQAVASRIGEVAWSAIHQFKGDVEHYKGVDIPPHWIQRFTGVFERTRHYLYWHRWPNLEVTDLRDILVAAAYDPRFARTSRTNPKQPWIWPIRPADAVPVLADRELLAEVVRSLLENARKSTPVAKLGGHIWAEVKHDRTTAFVTITDNGAGASGNIVRKLNDVGGRPFSALKSTGYGTRLCQRIVHLHGGSITFSSPGTQLGMTVEIRLPLAPLTEDPDAR